MKIKSKFWPLFVEATFGSKPETYFWYVTACITAVIIIPISWIGVLVNYLTMKTWRDDRSKPFPLLMSIFILPLACATGVRIYELIFPHPTFTGAWDKFIYAWSLGFPGLIALTVVLFIGILVAAAIVALIMWVWERISANIKFGKRVTYKIDEVEYKRTTNNHFGGCSSDSEEEAEKSEVTDEDETTG